MLIYYSPKFIEDKIRQSIIGQDEGVSVIATALSAHLLRLINYEKNPDHPLQKDNVILIGPTGCGKTETIRTIIRELKLPIPITEINAAFLSSSGYKGKNLDSAFLDLQKEAEKILQKEPNLNSRTIIHSTFNKEEEKKELQKRSVKIANMGIVLIDEIDKLRIVGNEFNEFYEGNFFPRKIQQELLKILEGTTSIGEDPLISEIDTKNILFILAGAHVGLDSIIKWRLNPKPQPTKVTHNRFGFGVDEPQPVTVAPSERTYTTKELIPTTKDLINYGYIPELIGRCPIICRFNALTVVDLYKILTTSAISPAKNFQHMIALTDNKLIITNNALFEIAKKAASLNTGARGLRTVLASIVYPILHQINTTNQVITITAKTVNSRMPPIVQSDSEQRKQNFQQT